ncbi:hypothetical protein DRE_00204 [Drechslerella stenobrocha 248]|uniref:Peptidase A1 domain-containing protein n=1 Tax=Drechslerella stenobrocha 248 TaxID=1043628 RepID=W7HZG0_9PEZI|nr:hypothetical protein DRE_00204 [Drechslerella stenobrocha 248]
MQHCNLRWWWIISLARAGAVSSFSCAVDPLVVPYGNTTLRPDVQSFGIPFTVGGQNFALKPTNDFAITYIASVPRECADTGDPIACSKDPNKGDVDEVRLGGLFNTKTSGTYKGPIRWNSIGGGREEETTREQRHYAEETIKIGDSVINDFLLLSSDKMKPDDTNYLGLGKNSTILNALYDMGRIPSKVWGYWGGWTGVTKQTIQEGSLVLGGYDESKVSGGFVSYKVTNDQNGCNLRILIKDIRLRAINGVETSIFDRGMNIDACISPTFNSLSLPRNMVLRIAQAGDFSVRDEDRSLGLYGWGFKVPVADNNGFSLTIELEDVKINIPNHQLFHPLRYTTQNDVEIINGSTTQVFQVNSLQDINRNDLSQLGWPFLSSAYIVVDPEEETFSVAQAVQSIVTSSRIVSVVAPACTTGFSSFEKADGGGPQTQPPEASSTPTTTTNADASLPDSTSGPLSASLIGCIVGVAALLVLSAALWFFVRRRFPAKGPTPSSNGTLRLSSTLVLPELSGADGGRPPQPDGGLIPLQDRSSQVKKSRSIYELA